MDRINTEFVASAPALGDCPKWDRIEIAIVGRSNVGKSSLLNALAGRKGLARTSRTPGRTQTLNFFAAGESMALVDLPGFGYAKMPQAVATRIAAAMQEYLAKRTNLAALLLLVDSRRGPGREEIDLAQAARERGLAVLVAATKCDKLKRSERAAARGRMQALEVEVVMCSAETSEGIDLLRRQILSVEH